MDEDARRQRLIDATGPCSSSLVQYKRDTRQLSSYVRFNWIPKPGTDFFVVYDELDSDRGGLTPRNRWLTVKLAYLFSL